MKEYRIENLSVGLQETVYSEVSLEDVEKFAALSGDVSPVHISDEFAKSKGLGGRIAHGLLIGARISALIGNELPGKFGILQTFELDFRAPLIPPDRLQITGEVANVSQGTGQVLLKIQVRNTAGKLIANCQAKTLVRTPYLNSASL